MRTLVIGLLLTATAWGQTKLASLAPAMSVSPEIASGNWEAPEPVIRPSAPTPATPAEETHNPNRRQWLVLSMTAHTAAGFDAWTTRHNVNAGMQEMNPVLRPFAGSNALYPVMQIGPSIGDYVAWKMMRSNRPLFHKLWWAPQVASAGISFTCGAKNAMRF